MASPDSAVLSKARTGVLLRNWAEVYAASPEAYLEPASVSDVAEIVRACRARGKTLRVIGSGHSPNDCAMSNDVMISLRRMNRVLVVDIARAIVKVEAGITLHELNEALDRNGLAMPNLGSISDQSIAGAIATGTHGTGAGIGSLSSFVVELQMVDGTGAIVTASESQNSDLFRAALCSFGALGVVTGAVLQVCPAFDLRAVETEARLDAVLANVGERARSARFYRFWWFPHTNWCMEWRAEPLEPRVHRRDYVPPAVAASRGVLCTAAHAALAFARELWRSAAGWFWGMFVGFHLLQAALWLAVFVPALVPLINRLWRRLLFSSRKETVDRSDRAFNFNCLFRQHVDEWAIPAAALPEAMRRLRELLSRIGQRAHFPIEVRFVAGDDAWLSPCAGRPLSAYIGIIAYKPHGRESEYAAYFAGFEEAMAALGGRPHWAKDFGLRGDEGFAGRYPRWGDFKAMRAARDPGGVFANAFVRRTLGLPAAGPLPSAASTAAPAQAASAPAGAPASPLPHVGGAAAMPSPAPAPGLPAAPATKAAAAGAGVDAASVQWC